MASLTKPVATAMSILALADRGKLDLDERAAHYVPEFRGHGKERITLRQLLTHVSGLPVETPLADFERGRAAALARIFALSPKREPGESFLFLTRLSQGTREPDCGRERARKPLGG